MTARTRIPLAILVLGALACGRSPVEPPAAKDCGWLLFRFYDRGALIQVDSVRVPCQ